jgi:hypothetical protein
VLGALSFLFQASALGHFVVQGGRPLLDARFELGVGLLHGCLRPQTSDQESRLVRTHSQ